MPLRASASPPRRSASALRLFVYDWVDDDGTRWRGVAINPELWITPPPAGEADVDEESEGCLSFPGERFPLRRAERAILRATDLDGKPFEIEAEGWLARIFQHEFDHLDGMLYVDRLGERDQKHRARRSAASSAGASPACSGCPASTTSRTERPRTASAAMSGCPVRPHQAQPGHPLS